MLKVLFVIDSLLKGGKERRLVELLKALNGEKEIVSELVILSDKCDFPEIHDLGMRIIQIKRIIKKDPFIFFRLYGIIKDFNPDILNPWGLMPAVYCTPVSFLTGKKIVNSMIVNSPDRLDLHTRFFSSLTLPFSDVIAANSLAGLRSYKVKSRGTVIYNGYDFARNRDVRDSDELKKELDIPTRYVVGMIAGFRKHKDHKSLIIAANEICRIRDDVSFLLVGDGPTLETCKDLSETGKIKFPGKRSDVESLINICDVGVLSTYTEGISNSIVEFMAMGKPVVATDGGGTNEIITDSVTGLLVNRESPDMLREKILFLINNPDDRSKIGLNARDTIVKNFNIRKMTDDYIGLFKRVSER